MRFYRPWLCAIAFCAMLLAACGQHNPPDEHQPMPVEQSVFGEQVKQMRRIEGSAKQQMEGRTKDLNQRLDSAEGEANKTSE
jgi:hypothetical protein